MTLEQRVDRGHRPCGQLGKYLGRENCQCKGPMAGSDVRMIGIALKAGVEWAQGDGRRGGGRKNGSHQAGP